MIERLPLFALAVVFLSGCGKTDYQSVLARWTVESAEFGGQPTEDAALKKDVFIDSDFISFSWTDPMQHLFKLDPSKTPKQFDVDKPVFVAKYRSQVSTSNQWLGIYELDGDDLKICWDLDGQTRPTEFKTKAGDHCLLLVLKRKKM
jgi:uncharacterized protein (TIGR03067 family)